MRSLLFVAVLVVLLFQTACNSLQDIRSIVLESQIDTAEALWDSHHITDYRLRVISSSLWRGQIDTLRVRDHVIIEQSAVCVVTPLDFDGVCEVEETDLQMVTVEGLFAHVRYLVDQQVEDLSVEFHPIYGFPEVIRVRPLHASDADRGWVVEEFEPLDG